MHSPHPKGGHRRERPASVEISERKATEWPAGSDAVKEGPGTVFATTVTERDPSRKECSDD